LTIANTNYVLTRAGGNEVARAAIHNLLPFVTILPLDEVIVKRALATFDFDDTEDAMQYHTALSNNIPVLISRDRTGFVSASITVAHPDEYIAGFSHEP
jgi:type II secretory pathway component PulK